MRGAIQHGLGRPPVRWIMLAAPFTGGVTIYAFYAMQPYLLELHGHERAYAVAGEAMVSNMLLDDASEGIGAFLGKRAPEWRGR